MFSRYVLFSTKHLNKICLQKENRKHIFYYYRQYRYYYSTEANNFLLKNNAKEKMNRKILSKLTQAFKKELMRRKLLFFLTLSIMAVSIDIRCVSCDKPFAVKFMPDGSGKNDAHNTLLSELEHLYEQIDETKRFHMLKNEDNIYMVQYAANSPIEDRCYACNLTVDTNIMEREEEKRHGQDEIETIGGTEKEKEEIEIEKKEEDDDDDEMPIQVKNEEDREFVLNFEKNYKAIEKKYPKVKITKRKKKMKDEENKDLRDICLSEQNEKSTFLRNMFSTQLKCKNDEHKTENNFLFVGVVDGHGGSVIAEIVKRFLRKYVKRELQKNVENKKTEINEKEIIKSLEKAHVQLDEDIRNNVDSYIDKGLSKYARVGACSLSILIDNNNYYISNLGDAQGLLGKKKGYVQLNNIHNANTVAERRKLIENHPNENDIVICKTIKNQESRKQFHMLNISDNVNKLLLDNYNHCYVKGRLQPTRVFGDFYLKFQRYAFDSNRNKYIVQKPFSFPYISSTPEIRKFKRSSDDEFIVLMTDGVTDFLSNEEIVNVVRNNIGISVEHASKAVVQSVLKKAAEEAKLTMSQLLSVAPYYKRQLHDDTTVLIIKLNNGVSANI